MKTFREFARGKNIGRVLFNRLVEKHVKTQGLTLDLGCTEKMSYYRFMDSKEGLIFMGDRSKTKDVSIILDLEEGLPFKDNSVDNIIIFNVLEHVYRPYRLIAETRRVLKKDGKLYVGVPFMVHYHPSPHDYSRYTREKLEKMLEGFQIETFETTGGFFTVFDYNFTTYFLDAVKIRYLRNIVSYVFYVFSQAFDRKMVNIRGNYKEKFPLQYFIVAGKTS